MASFREKLWLFGIALFTFVMPIPTIAQTDTLADPANYIPIFIEHACLSQIPLNYESECGTLFVPENRMNPDSATIEIAVRIVKTKNIQPKPDPIVYLVGGPGGSVVDQAPDFFVNNLMSFARDRDIILFDQRGTGASRPRLQCDGLINSALNSLTEGWEANEDRLAQQYASEVCSGSYRQQGVDLSAYTSAASAADVDDLRIALGYERWNLFGVSYGTRLALTVMRDYPDGIRSVILDSVYPPQVNLFTEFMNNALRALNVLFEGCRADERCYEAYPETEDRFYRLYEQLNESPETIRLVSSAGDEIKIVLNGDRLFDWTFRWLYSIDNIRHIPRWLYEIDNEMYTAAVRAGLRQELSVYGIDQGLYQAVQCYDEISFTEPDAFRDMRDNFPQYTSLLDRMLTQSEIFLSVCTGWHTQRANDIENSAVSSDIPTLLLSGEYDPVTPPSWAALAAQTLSQSYLYNMPGVGHAVVFSSTCGHQMAFNFLQSPTEAPNDRCVGLAPSPAFVVTRLSS